MSGLFLELSDLKTIFFSLENIYKEHEETKSELEKKVLEKAIQRDFLKADLELLKSESFENACKVEELKQRLEIGMAKTEEVISDTYFLGQIKAKHMAKESKLLYR